LGPRPDIDRSRRIGAGYGDPTSQGWPTQCRRPRQRGPDTDIQLQIDAPRNFSRVDRFVTPLTIRSAASYAGRTERLFCSAFCVLTGPSRSGVWLRCRSGRYAGRPLNFLTIHCRFRCTRRRRCPPTRVGASYCVVKLQRHPCPISCTPSSALLTLRTISASPQSPRSADAKSTADSQMAFRSKRADR